MLRYLTIVASVGTALACVVAAQAVIIETMPVGNPGNAADSTGYGSVGYTYNIGKYEVTAGQYCEFLNAVAQTDTYTLYHEGMWYSPWGCRIEQIGSPGNYSYSVAGDYADRPVNYVNWGDAARFANWLHNGQPSGAQDLSTTEDGAYSLSGAMSDVELLAVSREADWKWAIATEDEWYKAAYHKNDGATANYFDYPTSSDSAPGRDLTETTSPGNNANCYGIPWPIDSPYYTTVAGEFELSDSPYGTFDQGGNVWEWNEAILSGSNRGQRGGAHNYNFSYLRASYRQAYTPLLHSHDTGFRLSAIPEPAAMVMLALGSLGILRRRRA